MLVSFFLESQQVKSCPYDFQFFLPGDIMTPLDGLTTLTQLLDKNRAPPSESNPFELLYLVQKKK